MSEFIKFVYTPIEHGDVTLIISACRAGGVGVLNAEYEIDSRLIVNQLGLISKKGCQGYGLKVDVIDEILITGILDYTKKGLRWLILDSKIVNFHEVFILELRRAGVKVLAELNKSCWSNQPLDQSVDGLILKGNEAGGFVGENSSFILFQKWHKQTKLPLYIHGGLTPHVAAACSAVGVAGGVFDSQVLLLDESRLPDFLRSMLSNLAGNETVLVGDGEQGEYFRLLVRPGHADVQAFVRDGEGQGYDEIKRLISTKINWKETRKGLLPIGQDVCFAGPWQKKYGHLVDLFKAIDSAIENNLLQAIEAKSILQNSPLAKALGLKYPLVQGPMTRVSDSPEFAAAVAKAGALPMLALALQKGPALRKMLSETMHLLGDSHWGIGLLGFIPQELFDEQLTLVTEFHPNYAIIAGGRPDQAVRLEEANIPTFLHVPTANLISLFIQEGARRFIFEGRECGGHIGPLSSFVLWSTMVDRLLAELKSGKVEGSEVEVLFAGGIHDAVSSAMVQVLVAPLAAMKVKIGILMGSAYLFTKEIVSCSAILPLYQEEVINCNQTVNLESGPGHASCCAYTPFAKEFFRKRVLLRKKDIPADEGRKILDDLIMGRLRIASKGSIRKGSKGKIQYLDEAKQHEEGMYMLGQVATLRSEVIDIALLHRQVTEDAAALLAAQLSKTSKQSQHLIEKPVDIAIVGMACLLPKANSIEDYWNNILSKVDAITEIPLHRWDWRLYFDENRAARDKIYSKWGGFIDDMPFDPIRYGMPPKSIESIDPMQLMALEVAQRTLVDSGYQDRDFNRERASVILGVSGGTGDVGTQYGLRAELPRFQGFLPENIADRLPEWTEDSFAGLLNNVSAGRIANRLNLGGVNFTTDAACASALAALYQSVSELSSGRSDFVITGGIDTVQGPFGYLCFSKTQALSPRGRSSAFDASADGIVISEGIAMVALKRLNDAERDGDRIYAVIKGVGGSSDGNAKGMTAPLPEGQLRAMRRTYVQAGFDPDSVGLFEAHGTGTVAGDTAELESTMKLIKERNYSPKQAVIGSVKTMIGHTKATAGMAGLIKAALALHRRVLPPHLGASQPNQVLQQTDCPFYLTDQAQPWIVSEDTPRRASVSSFGFGGTNFHVALEEYTQEYRNWLCPAASHKWPAELLLWSDISREGLIVRLLDIQRALSNIQNIEFRDLASNLARKWQMDKEIVAIVAKDPTDLTEKISVLLAHLQDKNVELPAGVYYGSGKPPAGKLAVLFPGQGSQYTGMLREVSLYFPIYADVLAEADRILNDAFVQHYGESKRLSHFIFPRGCYSEDAKADAQQVLTNTDIAQPALGAVEAGLWKLLQMFEIEPDMLAGHSYGEFAALHASGAIDFNTLMILSSGRGRFIIDAAKTGNTELGTMLAVQACREDIEAALAGHHDVTIANHNAPLQSVLSGSRFAIKAAEEKLLAAGIITNQIPVAAAFHSSLVKPAQCALADLIDNVEWQPCLIPVYSNTTARPHAAEVDITKKLMAQHLVCPVEFVAEIEAMYQDGARIFLELGPKSVLSRLTDKILTDRPHRAVSIDDSSGLSGMLHAFGQLICAGINLNVMKLFDNRDCIVGDPARLESLQRCNAVPKHAWMLNGSSVRPASEPIKQVGVTVDQVANQALNTVQVGAGKQENIVYQTDFPDTKQAQQQKPCKKENQMRERRPLTTSGNSAVMTEYFETMRQFLETQERVMTAYIGEPIVDQGSVREQRIINSYMPPKVQAYEAIQEQEPAKQVQVTQIPVKTTAMPLFTHETPAQNISTLASAQPVDNVDKDKEKNKTVSSSSIGRGNITNILLGVIEEKTGYPPDMIGLDQNLESDLGIDSIKRIEIVGALLQKLPENYRQELGENRSKLNTQPTLNGLLDILCTLKAGGTVTAPFKFAEVGVMTSVISHPPRHIIQSKQEDIDKTALRQLKQGHYLITEDELGVAAELGKMLITRGCTVNLVKRAVLSHDDRLNKWCIEHKNEFKELTGVVHLAQLSRNWLKANAALDDWRKQLQINEKSIFSLLHDFSDKLVKDAHVLSASALGGFFNRHGSISRGELCIQGGAVGMLKSLFDERPSLRVKAVDIDPSQNSFEIASILLGEMELVGGRQEIGYPSGRRTIFRTVPSPTIVNPVNSKKMRNIIVLASGGARGVTAEVLRELACPGNTLILTGRNSLLDKEPEILKTLTTADALRQYFISEARNKNTQITPAIIRQKINAVLAAREMRSNLEDFNQRGATVEYCAVDVTNEDDMHHLLSDVYQRYGRIDGVVHGAGIIEDKLLADKKSDSWTRVVETKVIGLLILQKYLHAESLRFFTVFSSVAGRYGNSGQSDYATANEIMNRLCCQLSMNWNNQVNVVAFCWGPWGQTKFGAGMVTAETEAKFAENGVRLVTAETGRQLFNDEIIRINHSEVEIICGEGPWEERESSIGEIKKSSQALYADRIGPLIGRAARVVLAKGNQIINFHIDANQNYLQHHRIDRVPVLPAAAALEMFAEAAQHLWNGWKVVEIQNFRLLKGIDLKDEERKLSIVIDPPPYGNSDGFEVNAVLQSEQKDGTPLIHYKSTLRLEQKLPDSNSIEQVNKLHSEKNLGVVKAYSEWLFHGPCFQVIENIDGLSAAGARATVKTTHPVNWILSTVSEHDKWIFDPAVIDSAAQMGILWTRSFRDETALPTKFGRVIRYQETLPDRLHMEFEQIASESQDSNLLCANVYFSDTAGQMVFLIENMECVSSKALNRLGGTAKGMTKAIERVSGEL